MIQKQKQNKLDIFNVEVYKLNTITNFNQFIYLDNDKNIIFRETSLINIYDMLKDKDLDKFVKLVGLDKDIEKDERLQYEFKIKGVDLFLLDNQKRYFNEFKNKLLLSKVNVDGYTFKPVNYRVIDENGSRYFNLYIPNNKFNDLKPNEKAKFPCCEKLMRNLLQEGYEHFMDFLAWKLQKPCEIVPNHWIIQDDGGTGKTEILGDFILDRLFNISIIGQDELHSSFTSYMQNTTIIVAEEIEGYENEKKIKMLTGAKTIRIRDLYKSAFKVKNYNNWIIFSNDIRPLKISVNDRRFNVVGGGLRLAPASDGNWGKTLFGTEENNVIFFEKFHETIDQEIKSLWQYLMARKVSRTSVQQTLNSTHKQQLEEMNYTSEHEFFNEIKGTGLDGVVKEYYSKNIDYFFKDNLVKLESGDHEGYWIKVSAFYQLYFDYVKACNLKPISKNHLFRRISKVKDFNKVFGQNEFISFQGEKFRAIKLKTYKDENKELI